jgi:uncharacterized protein (DUF58 family)
VIHRRHGTKPGLALWMLVAVGDLALIVANLGVAMMIALLGVVTAAAAGLGASVMRRTVAARQQVPVPVSTPARRRG